MKILWCVEHGQAEYGEGLCLLEIVRRQDTGDVTDCEMVPMRLIPDNDETVERIAQAVTGKWVNDGAGLAVAVLAALDGETP